jgi:hypothetical protein
METTSFPVTIVTGGSRVIRAPLKPTSIRNLVERNAGANVKLRGPDGAVNAHVEITSYNDTVENEIMVDEHNNSFTFGLALAVLSKGFGHGVRLEIGQVHRGFYIRDSELVPVDLEVLRFRTFSRPTYAYKIRADQPVYIGCSKGLVYLPFNFEE